MKKNKIIKQDVLIIGAGPTGLTCACCLKQLNPQIQLTILEKNNSNHTAPSAHVINTRTLEIFRQIDAYDDIKKHACKPNSIGGIKFTGQISKIEYGKYDNTFSSLAFQRRMPAKPYSLHTIINTINKHILKPIANVSIPTMIAKAPPDLLLARSSPIPPMENLAQPLEEQVLTDVLRRKYNTIVQFNKEVVNVYDVKKKKDKKNNNNNNNNITILYVETSNGTIYECKYLIACDGSRSFIRNKYKIPWETTVPTIQPRAYSPSSGVIQHHTWIYFQTDLTPYFNGRNGPNLWWIYSSNFIGTIINYDSKNQWVIHTPYFPNEEKSPYDYTNDELKAIIYQAIGEKPLKYPVQIIARGVWQMTCNVATKYKVPNKNIFLAGDAAHCFPPSGGHGQNTGIQDVHNLCWKINAHMKGWAMDEILNTYEEERWPVGRYNADQSARNNKQMSEIEAAIGLIPPAPFKSKQAYEKSKLNLRKREEILYKKRNKKKNNNGGDGNGEIIKANMSKELELAIIRSESHWRSFGNILGFTYEEGALLPDQTTFVHDINNPLKLDLDVSDGSVQSYSPTTRPGSRLPHVFVKILFCGSNLKIRNENKFSEFPFAPFGITRRHDDITTNNKTIYTSLHDCIAIDAITILTFSNNINNNTSIHIDWKEILNKSKIPLQHVHVMLKQHSNTNIFNNNSNQMVVEIAPSFKIFSMLNMDLTPTEIFELNHNNNTNNNHQQPLSFLLIRPDQIVGARFYHDKNIRTTTEIVQKQVNEGVECIVGKKKVRNINKRGGDWPIKKDDTTRNNVLVASSSSNIQFGGLNDSNVLLGTRGGRNSKL